MHMTLAILSLIGGIGLLMWSANRFIDGAAATARYLGMPPLLIGMLIVGFGTSAPEMVVSTQTALQGSPGLALGNAYGSNIGNIGLILGLTAIISPIAIHSQVLRKEFPLLIGVTILAAWQLWDGEISRLDAAVLLLGFLGFVVWSIWQSRQQKDDAYGVEIEHHLTTPEISRGRALLLLVLGLVLLIISSRILVWGAVGIAQAIGMSDLIIGLTVVAVGTSLPELASSLIAARRGEDDISLGNILGSNLFNTLAVVGIASSIQPIVVGPEVLTRDVLVMAVITVVLFLMGFSRRGNGSIGRGKGLLLLVSYAVYTAYLIITNLPTSAS
jgi:cation:H+ antiporter